MMTTNSKDFIESNPKNKKRIQILMSRNYYEPENNSCVEKNSISEIDTNNPAPQENVDFELPSVKKEIYFSNSQKVTHGLQNTIVNTESNAATEENIVNKSRFEEIENKLEEMFAGIEDEQLENTVIDEKNTSAKDSQDSINNFAKATYFQNNNKHPYEVDCEKYDKLISLPTKAAKKSTSSISSNENMIKLNSELVNQDKNPIPNTLLYLKTMRRRHSIGTNMESLTCSQTNNVKLNETKSKKVGIFKERDIKMLVQDSETHNEIKKKKTKYVRKRKIKNNRKKEINFIKSNSRNSKKKNSKSESYNKSSQQKLKQHILSSENDTEERPLQTRDVEIKHKSPFILVKNNGSVTVVNTVTADESNEKWTRSKKTSNYVYERKTVKGCHSSTLSNRYDAETADSSWICVLCKIGPHKIGLGDLFGPYIISSDCDEFKSIKELIEKSQTCRRTDASLFNFSNKSVKCFNESNLGEQAFNGCNEVNTINNYTLGMSQVSNDCYEIWIHEECAIWAPNIFVIGSRLAGLEDVTWNSIRYECEHCLKHGALICCMQRDCKATSHVPCAREFNWLLDESKFWAYCNKHVVN